MPFLGDMVGSGAGAASYTITNAVRLDGSADYFSRTPGSATNSGSIWVKKHENGTVNPIFDGKISFNTSDRLVAFGLTSTAAYRDTSAWMHIFWNNTGVWVNGSSVTGTGTYSQSGTTNPRIGYDGTNYASISVSDFAYYDGASVSITGGGSDGTTGSWKAARPSGTPYSWLDFANTADLGNDVSGNNNDWTLNSLSSADAVIDTPTNNFCTLNPLDNESGGSGAALSNGNLSVSDSGDDTGVRGTVVVSAGKWVWEVKYTGGNADWQTGIASATAPLSAGSSASFVDAVTYAQNGRKNVDGTLTSGGVTLSVNDIVRVELDADAASVQFFVNGATQWTISVPGGVPAPWFPVWKSVGGADSAVFNFGATAFTGTPTTSFKALCTANLPATTGATSGSFTGNASTDGPFVWTGAPPNTLTIDGNAVTWGTHSDKLANGFKIRTASSPYNDVASNSWTATYTTPQKPFVGSNKVPGKAQGNP
jgi:hypothetical protein